MAILAECPICHKKQAVSRNLCIGKLKGGFQCEADLKKLKRQKEKVRYYISFRIPGSKGKQRMEYVGYSIAEARDAEGKRKSQKRENRIFDMLPESEMTFNELTKWYLDLSKVKGIADYDGTKIRLNNFNKVFGNKIINTIKPVDLENYQAKRNEQGLRNVTIDQELTIVKTMIKKAFDNDKVSGRTLKAFLRVKNVSTKAERTRTRKATIEEYLKLVDEATPHLKGMLIVAFNTGMRPGEIRGLKWSYIDRKSMFIRLPAEITKGKAPREIPINHHVKAVLDSVPRAINHAFVFTYKGKPVKSRSNQGSAFHGACQRAGIPYGRKPENGLIMQDFRRTFKTNMLKAGIDGIYRDKIVGHSLKGMDAHYIVPDEDDLRNAMDIFTEWVDLEIATVNQTVNQNTITV